MSTEQETRRTSPLRVGQRVKAIHAGLMTLSGAVPVGTIGEVLTVHDNNTFDVRFAFYVDGVVRTDTAPGCGRWNLETVLGKPRMIGEARPGQDGEQTPSKPRRGAFLPYRSALTDAERSRIGDDCPKCGKGSLREKHGKRGPFVGCDQYHVTGCTFTVRDTGEAHTPSAESDPENGGAKFEQDEQDDFPGMAQDEPQGDSAPSSLDAIIANIARKAAAGTVNEAKVRAIVSEAIARWSADHKPGDREIVVSIKDAPKVTVKGKAHARLADVLQAIAACDPTGEETGTVSYPNVMLVGPAGSGKTTLAMQIAECLGLTWDAVSCHPEMPGSRIEGRMLVKLMSGEEVYVETGFVRVFRDGGVWINDEGDNMNGSLSIIYNAALANGWLILPTGERVTRHQSFIFVHCANTYGSGADPVYVREQQDAAFLDRFVGMKFFVDYDLELEQTLCPEVKIREAVYGVRRKVQELGLKGCIVGTRALVTARRIVTREGKSVDEALRRITDGWTKHNRQSCGVPLAA